MAATSENLIDFDVIENQKENIQTLPGGRSAKALASLYSPSPADKLLTPTPSDTRNLLDLARETYEKELLNISESDDPLDIYDRYVKWTLEAYPSAQATAQSQLLPLLERATKAFLTSTHYKNDPRYLKLWLHYIRLFSDSPRETFAFLARHNIGEGLALFYEEFAAWLEGAGRWTQAEEVYKMGIEREARPQERLIRKFGDFQLRFEQRPASEEEPSSPALPTVRPALAAKVDPFVISTPQPADPQAPRTPAGLVTAANARGGRQKLAVFSDADAPDSAGQTASGETSRGWQNIGTVEHRRKENVVEARPWAGETLKTGSKSGPVSKMAIFKDESSSHHTSVPSTQLSLLLQSDLHKQESINPRTGRIDRVFVNLRAVYPDITDPQSELDFEALRAEKRGWLDVDWAQERKKSKSSTRALPRAAEKETAVDDSFDTSQTRSMQDDDSTNQTGVLPDDDGTSKDSRHHKSRKLKVVEVKSKPQTIQTKLESPTGPKIRRKASAEPTMTFHTRAATDEIYGIFNQPLKNPAVFEEEDSGDSGSDDDYTSAGESTGTGRISMTSATGQEETSEVKSVSEWSEFSARKHIPEVDDESTGAISEDPTGRSFHTETSQVVNDEIFEAEQAAEEELVTPIFPDSQQEQVRTKFVPIAPEDYEPPTGPYRDPFKSSQNRLPFMTPIAEKTESSLAPSTVFEEKDYFNSKTPSRGQVGTPAMPRVPADDWSSPFQEIINDASRGSRLAQPALVKSERVIDTKPKTKLPAPGRDVSSKGPIIKDTQCNPVDESIRNQIFEGLQPPLSTYEGFDDQRNGNYGRGAEVRKFVKAAAKMNKNGGVDKTSTNVSVPPVLIFPGSNRKYTVKKELGKGAFAPVYLVEQTSASEEEVPNGNVNTISSTRNALEAIKSEDPPSSWEFYMLRQASRRLGVSRAAESIVRAHELHLFADECYLVIDYASQGTLLDLVNLARSDAIAAGTATTPTAGLEESLACFFAIELFRTVEALHSKGIIHGDLKGDNCLVRLSPLPRPTTSDEDGEQEPEEEEEEEEEEGEEWSTTYSPVGALGWSSKGLTLIDFGRGIDTRQFQPNTTFIADWKTGPQDCAEMREMRPWTYHVDYFGMAGVVHLLLFGRYIDTVLAPSSSSSSSSTSIPVGAGGGGRPGAQEKRYKLRDTLKRYWAQEMWSRCFDLLLNPAFKAGEAPPTEKLKAVREEMETWLVANCLRGSSSSSSSLASASAGGGGLKASLKRLEERIGRAR